MQHVSAFITISFLFYSAATHAQDPYTIPKGVQKHMASMVGSWTFDGKSGDKKITGAETIRLASNKTALIQEGYILHEGGHKEHYVIVSGWDGDKKTTLVRAFTSDGVTWAGEWKKLKNGKWQGSASGKSASFELKKDWMRYEDGATGSGNKPWIAEYTRIKKQKSDTK